MNASSSPLSAIRTSTSSRRLSGRTVTSYCGTPNPLCSWCVRSRRTAVAVSSRNLERRLVDDRERRIEMLFALLQIRCKFAAVAVHRSRDHREAHLSGVVEVLYRRAEFSGEVRVRGGQMGL